MIPHARAFAEVLNMQMTLFAVSVPHAMPMAPLGTELLIDPGALEAESQGRNDYLRECTEVARGKPRHRAIGAGEAGRRP